MPPAKRKIVYHNEKYAKNCNPVVYKIMPDKKWGNRL